MELLSIDSYLSYHYFFSLRFFPCNNEIVIFSVECGFFFPTPFRCLEIGENFHIISFGKHPSLWSCSLLGPEDCVDARFLRSTFDDDLSPMSPTLRKGFCLLDLLLSVDVPAVNRTIRLPFHFSFPLCQLPLFSAHSGLSSCLMWVVSGQAIFASLLLTGEVRWADWLCHCYIL